MPIGCGDVAVFPGDVIVEFVIDEHKHFNRVGSDLVTYQNISITEAILGAKKQIKLLDGMTRDFVIPAYTQHGHKLKLENAGLPVEPNALERGLLIVNINVLTPTGLTDEQVEIIKTFDKSYNEKL